jgi:IS4 transposase
MLPVDSKEATLLDQIFKPFVDQSPITVMAAAALTRLLSAERLDALFDKNRDSQYCRQLMFSTVFSLMASVVTGTRKSIHHAYESTAEKVEASVVAVYDKLKNIEPSTAQAVVRDMAAEVIPLIEQMGGALPPLVPGYRVKILDGNCIAASEHRIKELRQTAAGALPGKSLVVLDAQPRVILDVFPCEDGHAQERSLLEQVLPTVVAGDLWIEDRNFCTFGFLTGIADRQAHFITRQHGNTTCEPMGPRKKVGVVDGGTVYEEPVRVRGADGRELNLRRIVMQLDNATRDGDKTLSLLTNLPAKGPGGVSGVQVGQLYRGRWKIEAAFQELAQHFNSEIKTLGYPKAALFGFCVALVIFNAVSLMKAALRGCHGAQKVEEEVSNYYIAAEIETTSRGMLIAISPEHWQPFETMPPTEFATVMLMLAGKVNLRHYKKHPRGPKKPQPKRNYDPAHPHVSTAKLLAMRSPRKRRAT